MIIIVTHFNYKDEKGKRKSKWIATGLPVKGNKKKAESMLQDARKNFEIPSESVVEQATQPIETKSTQDEDSPTGILFTDFMLEWLDMMKYRVEVTTHAAYSFNVKGKIAPYFKEKGILLEELQAKHLQDFYQFVLNKYKITTHTAQKYHANIRQALQHAFKMDMIRFNPADKVDRPKKNQFVGSFYTNEELNQLFEAVKDDPV
ncbi:phage integrase SAM-like domain-containing protein [Paenibacillus oleatilyticus]|uniref:phage integrase SAM-like domain-containing protein n=1 Tax=Paenibacillus oleatilyticus TaxID=2594886 RepID=UPI0035A592AD